MNKSIKDIAIILAESAKRDGIAYIDVAKTEFESGLSFIDLESIPEIIKEIDPDLVTEFKFTRRLDDRKPLFIVSSLSAERLRKWMPPSVG